MSKRDLTEAERMWVFDWLKLPEKRSCIDEKDGRSLTLLHAKIIQKKPFLKKIYVDFYNQFKKSMGDGLNDKVLVELGSGGGFLKDIIPNVITSDIINLPDVDLVFSAISMPFGNNTIDGFLMFDVLHHVNDAMKLFNEIVRCLKPTGRVVMIEPAGTLWGKFVHRYLHYERYNPSGDWHFEKGSTFFLANTSLPWIIFYRDRNKFEAEFPSLKIVKLKPHTPFRYLVSGGVSVYQLLPFFMYNLVKAIESMLAPFNKYLGMFLTIVLEKK